MDKNKIVKGAGGLLIVVAGVGLAGWIKRFEGKVSNLNKILQSSTCNVDMPDGTKLRAMRIVTPSIAKQYADSKSAKETSEIAEPTEQNPKPTPPPSGNTNTTKKKNKNNR